MKRAYVALALLVVVAVGCVVSILLETRELSAMIRTTDEIERYCHDGDIAKAERLADTLKDEFSQKSDAFALFLHHNVLLEIEESLVALPYHLRCGEIDHVLSELARCRLFLETQLETELPTWDNIL